MLPAIDSALSVLNGASTQMHAVSTRIASEGASGDLATSVVQMSEARAQVKAAVAIVKTADEMIGTIIDVLA